MNPDELHMLHSAPMVYADVLQDRGDELAAQKLRILVEPENDAHRLAYANVVGGEWGEFIRLHCHHSKDRTRGTYGNPPCQRLLELQFKLHHQITQGMNQSFDATYDRGFIGQVKCTAKNWMKCADSLVWQSRCQRTCCAVGPNHLVMCNGGRFQSPDAQFSRVCVVCSGTGYVLSPVPPTAQPITRVKLTTWPRLGQGLVTLAKQCQESLKSLWPQIEFDLPPPNATFLPMRENAGFVHGTTS